MIISDYIIIYPNMRSLYRGYRVFTGNKVAGAWHWTLTFI